MSTIHIVAKRDMVRVQQAASASKSVQHMATNVHTAIATTTLKAYATVRTIQGPPNPLLRVLMTMKVLCLILCVPLRKNVVLGGP